MAPSTMLSMQRHIPTRGQLAAGSRGTRPTSGGGKHIKGESFTELVERAILQGDLLQRLLEEQDRDDKGDSKKVLKKVTANDVKRVAFQAIFIICSTTAESVRKTLGPFHNVHAVDRQVDKMFVKKNSTTTAHSFFAQPGTTSPSIGKLHACIKDLLAVRDNKSCEKIAKAAVTMSMEVCKQAGNDLGHERYTNFADTYKYEMRENPLQFYKDLKITVAFLEFGVLFLPSLWGYAAILSEWHRNNICWHVLARLFDGVIETYMSSSSAQPLSSSSSSSWVSYVSNVMGITYPTTSLDSMAFLVLLAFVGIALYKRMWNYHKNLYLGKFFDAFFNTYQFPSQGMPVNRGQRTTMFPFYLNHDDRFSWVTSATKRIYLQRFADRCRYQASGTEEGANVDVVTHQAFDELDDPLLLEDYVQLTSGHCYSLDSMREHIRAQGRHARDLVQNTVLTKKDRDLIDAMANDQSVHGMKSFLAFLQQEGGGPLRGLSSRVARLCTGLVDLASSSPPLAPLPFMFMRTSTRTDVDPDIKCGVVKVKIGILDDQYNNNNNNNNSKSWKRIKNSIKDNGNGNAMTLFFPNNRAGMRLVSMLEATSTLIVSADHAKLFLSILRMANGYRDRLGVSDIKDDEQNRSGHGPFIAVMYAINAMYTGLQHKIK
jgi:hypothetical protein